jgi:hypothetical protein
MQPGAESFPSGEIPDLAAVCVARGQQFRMTVVWRAQSTVLAAGERLGRYLS